MSTRARTKGKSELIRHSEICERADMTLDEIKQKVVKGTWPLPHSRLDRIWRWRRDVIEHWLKTGEWPEGAVFEAGMGRGRDL